MLFTTTMTGLLGCALLAQAPSAPVAQATAPVRAASPAPARASAARLFVQRYERAVNERDLDTIRASIGQKTLIERGMDGVELSEEFRNGFREGALEGFDWAGSLAAGLGESGHYRLLRVRESDGATHALLRLVNDQGGVNYHDVEVRERPGGGFEIVDVYVYLSGERLSETVRRSLLQFLAAMNQGDDSYVNSFAAIGAMAQLLQAGRYAEADALYREMPPNLRGDKLVMIMHVQCATQLDDSVLDRACDEFRRLYPNDPCADLLTLDQLIIRQEWDDAMEVLDRMQKRVGPDAYLDDLMANVLLQQGRVAEAKQAARRAIDREPSLDEGYWTLLEIALREKDHGTAARQLTLLETRFGWVFENLDQVKAYSAFVASAEYGQWRSGQYLTSAER